MPFDKKKASMATFDLLLPGEIEISHRPLLKKSKREIECHTSNLNRCRAPVPFQVVDLSFLARFLYRGKRTSHGMDAAKTLRTGHSHLIHRITRTTNPFAVAELYLSPIVVLFKIS